MGMCEIAVQNNCGQMIACGGCAAPETCGALGMPNVCGCESPCPVWHVTVVSKGFVSADDLAVEKSNDDVLLAGTFSGDVTIGNTTLPPTGNSDDIYITKFDGGTTGNNIWTKSFPSTGDVSQVEIGTNSSSEIFVAGSFEGDLLVGTNTLMSSGSYDVFLSKLDPSGAPLWSKTFGASDVELVKDLAVDQVGRVVIAGEFNSSAITFGGEMIMSKGSADIFVAKLDQGGGHVWSKGFGNTTDAMGDDVAYGMALDGDDNVLLTGAASGNISFGGSPLTCGSHSIWIAKLEPGGDHVWSKCFDAGSDSAGHNITSDLVGDVYVVGTFNGTVDFGCMEPITGDNDTIFLAKFSRADGTCNWVKGFGGTAELSGEVTVGLLGEGALMISGGFTGSMAITDSLVLTTNGNTYPDVFVAKFHPDGFFEGAKSYGDQGYQVATAMAVRNAAYVAGTFVSSIDFGLGEQHLPNLDQGVFLVSLH